MKVLNLSSKARVYVYSEPINMGCSFPKLIGLVEDQLKQSVTSGDLYVFMNKTLDYVKILFWAVGGPCILSKRLIQGCFDLKLNGKVLSISGLQSVLDNPNIKRLSAPIVAK